MGMKVTWSKFDADVPSGTVSFIYLGASVHLIPNPTFGTSPLPTGHDVCVFQVGTITRPGVHDEAGRWVARQQALTRWRQWLSQ